MAITSENPLKIAESRKSGAEAIFNLEDGIELRESHGFKISDLSRAQELAEEHREIIIHKWHEYLG